MSALQIYVAQFTQALVAAERFISLRGDGVGRPIAASRVFNELYATCAGGASSASSKLVKTAKSPSQWIRFARVLV